MVDNLKILVHYDPGARGDFLASILLQNDIIVRDNFAIHSPPTDRYIKIHDVQDNFLFLDQSDYTTIRIQLPKKLESLMQITHSHFLKNPTYINNNFSKYENYYYYLRYIISNELVAVTYKNKYDYWIDYENLFDLNFIENLYLDIHKKSMSSELKTLTLLNINDQDRLNWKLLSDSDKLSKLLKLIKFEIESKTISKDYEHTFQIVDLINSKDSVLEKYFSVNNYRKKE